MSHSDHHHSSDFLKKMMMHNPRFNFLSLVVAGGMSIYAVFSSAYLFISIKLHLIAFFGLFLGSLVFIAFGYLVRGVSALKISFTFIGPFFLYLALMIGLFMTVDSMFLNPEMSHVFRHMKILLILSTLSAAYCSGRFLGLQRDYVAENHS